MVCTILVALLTAAVPGLAQETPADTALVLPDDDPLRPQPPPRTDLTPMERLFRTLGWIGTRPFEFLGTGAEGTAIWYEDRVGGFAEGLSGSAMVPPEEPGMVSITGGSLGTRSGFVGGGVHVHTRSGPTGARAGVTAAFTNRLYQEYTAYVGLNDPSERPYAIVTGFYDMDTMDRFWGLGPLSDEELQSSFSWERRGARAMAGLPEEKRGLRANLHGGWEESIVFEGDALDEPDMVDVFPEFALPTIQLASAGAGLGYDLRDAAGHPTSGVFASGAATWWTSTDDNEFEWLHWSAQAQAHIPLGSAWHILSLKASAEEADPTGDLDEIPFFYLPTLGGSGTLRGFDSWRFRDRATAHATAAFRWRIWLEHTQNPDKGGVLEAALFYDTGTVGSAIDEISRDEIKHSYGLTISAYLLDSHLMTFGAGYSEEAIRLIFSTRDVW